jgi:multiple sugar transport system substrate-binding protein
MKISRKKIELSILCIILIGIVFTIYSIEKNKTVILKLGVFAGSNWDASNDKSMKIIEDAIAGFEKKHPNVEVEYENGILREDYSEWLAGKILIDNEPDVFMVIKEDFNVLSSKGMLMNLDELIENDKSFSRQEYYYSLLKAGQYKQQQYALPYESVPMLMCVNTTLLKKEGIEIPSNNWTWGDFHQICRQIIKDNNKDGTLDQFGVYNYSWKDAAYSNGITLFNGEGTESYIGDRNAINAVNFVYRINMLTDGYMVTEKDFENGKVAFSPMSFMDYSIYKTYPWKIEKYTKFDWTCIAMPAGPEGDNISEVDSLLFGISGRTNNKENAWELLKMLTYDGDIQSKVYSYSKSVSPLKSVSSSKNTYELSTEKQEIIDVTLLNQVMNKAVAVPNFPQYDSALDMMNEGVQEAMDSDKNIRVYLLELQRNINNYLKN